MQMTVKIIVPMMLNIKWIIVARFAVFLLVPIDAKTAVIQVPILWPNKTNTALDRLIAPLTANACRDTHRRRRRLNQCCANAAPAKIPKIGY